MEADTLGGALEREHRQIDGGIEAYLAGLDGPADPAPLLAALTGLRRHIYLEEQFLFPPLKAAGLMGPIFVMLREHGQLWNSMDALGQLLADGADADARRVACTALLALLDAHNSKEEPIIYTQADTILSQDAGAELRDFLARGTTPEGWVAGAASR
ncbi:MULTISPECIES: hemerythrin domain-containing protein [unclassified Arthrobacter]|uniref:hemerythrin domain-containing protein n=1 Tax=unclassified Arthrobacter TaxID=235627 RepID=UPI00159E0897|nr:MULTISPECIES: hemerythrin domain-containing protein [unclassified Arthrobacter]MCQ9166141.1 hemerythrin domain-containing protein [Arthrobacter sp. STN4]NVN00737.1 hemerythrin domain-containing protein [Arthrobacter sp. SDTb3-6]